jgi:alkanesulfonate monooxygenase SsuD/methylene tetrahydromethanopterin reductase-like flavin-dependent oxidoreductase (luciferase family)
MNGLWSVQEEAMVYQKTACSFIGTEEELLHEVQRFSDILEVDELMITTPVYDYEERVKSMAKFARLMQKVNN